MLGFRSIASDAIATSFFQGDSSNLRLPYSTDSVVSRNILYLETSDHQQYNEGVIIDNIPELDQ